MRPLEELIVSGAGPASISRRRIAFHRLRPGRSRNSSETGHEFHRQVSTVALRTPRADFGYRSIAQQTIEFSFRNFVAFA